MKKTLLAAIVATTLFACSTSSDTASGTTSATAVTDEATMNDFKENSKVAMSLFHGFENKDMTPFENNIADTAKIIGAKYGQGVLTKAENTANLLALTKLFSISKANDITLLPGVDTVTLKPNSDVRAYVRWTDDALNGAKIEHKYYALMQFNKDHKVILIDEYFDVTGMLNASTAPKK